MLDSLYLRLNLTSILVLAVFLSVTGGVLDNAFLTSARLALREHMLGQIYQLLTASAIDKNERLIMPLPTDLPDPQLALPDSGLYAFVADGSHGSLLWRSPSFGSLHLPQPFALQVGEKRWQDITLEDGKDYSLLGYGFQRTLPTGVQTFNFYLLTELDPLRNQVSSYRQRLWGGLTLAALLLLATQTWVLRWGLHPLRQVGRELSAIERGELDRLAGRYPREVAKLTGKINVLLTQERARQTRYRNALADLAHSLKTPLAVLRGALDQPDTLPTIVNEQSLRMMRIVEHQLQRAGTASAAASAPPITVQPIVERIALSLTKVYRDKRINVLNRVDPQLRFRCDEADLMEVLGNLLDNACKWCRGRVEILGYRDGENLIISIHDNGPGIDAEHIDQILRRGGRADESTPGHGLGLSVAADIIEAYQGRLRIGSSLLGGAAVIVEFLG